MNVYLQTKTQFPPAIFKKPSLNLGLVVVIPVCNNPFLLLSLLNFKKCRLPNSDVEVIAVIWDAEDSSDEIRETNKNCFETTLQWAKENSSPRLKFHILYFNELPKRKAGIGLAKKIGMDEACWRFEKARNPNGIITSLEVDSKCDVNFFEAVEDHFRYFPKCQAASIYSEFSLSGPDFSENHYKAFLRYELHLRYMTEAQRWAGFPFSTPSFASGFSVRWKAYMKKGGIPLNKEAETIAFLQKFSGYQTLLEINSTRIILSPGKLDELSILTDSNKGSVKTYHPEGFYILKQFFDLVEKIFHEPNILDSLPTSLWSFLKEIEFDNRVQEIQRLLMVNRNLEFNSLNGSMYRWLRSFWNITRLENQTLTF
ncbi:MAG: hypothetical protein R2769_13045 [Saprospiraceae bacterium]